MATNRELYFELKNLVPSKIDESSVKLILLDVNGFDSFSDLVKHFDDEVKSIDSFRQIVGRIMSGMPVQYAIGHAPFLDLDLKVNANVLIPRPETEELVLFAVSIIKNESCFLEGFSIVDIGTGTGAIAISLYRRVINSNVIATDISSEALEIAKENSSKYNAKINFLQGDMLTPLISNGIKVDVIISNPPYIEDEKTIDDNVYNNEPHLALIAKPATKYYEEIFKNASLVTKRRALMFFEIGENMEESLTVLVKKYLPLASYEFHRDIYNRIRFLYVRNDKYED